MGVTRVVGAPPVFRQEGVDVSDQTKARNDHSEISVTDALTSLLKQGLQKKGQGQEKQV